MDWTFDDPQNLAVIVSKSIIELNDWVAYVTHDKDDGGWQFHSPGQLNADSALVVSLRQIVDMDASLSELSNLPPGWHASRASPTTPWRRGMTT